MEVEYTTKVIEHSKYITDKNVVIKAFLRRGLAYESMEKYLQAKEDMISVKELQFDNKQASQCINRCNKAIKDIYGDNVPDVKKNDPVVFATDRTLVQMTEPVLKKEDSDDAEPELSVEAISSKFLEIKE